MKEDNKPVIRTQSDVIHMFANGITNLKKNNVESIDNKLYYYSLLIAVKYKDIVFIREFDNTSCFGNGLNTYNVSYAFDKSTTILICNELRDDLQFNVEQHFKYLFDKVENIIASIYRVIYDDTNVVRHDLKVDNDDYKYAINKFKNKVDLSFLDTKIKVISGEYYVGWSRKYYIYRNFNKSIRDTFNNRIFTNKEKLTYNAIKFWYKNIRGYSDNINRLGIKTSTLQDKINLYNNEDNKNIILNFNKNRKIREELNIINKNLIAIKKHNSDIIKWMNGERDNVLCNMVGYVVISEGIKLFDEDSIITSKGATVPINHAKLLYKIFKTCEANNEEFISNGKTISIGVYKVEYIKRGLCDNIEQYYLKAGCHFISSQIINEFVKINNLNW